MRALFVHLKSYGLLRWTYIIAIALIVIPGIVIFIINIFEQPSLMLTLLFVGLFCCLMLFGLPVLLGGILDIITNSKIPLRPVLLFFNGIIITGLLAGYSYFIWDQYLKPPEFAGNKWVLADLPIEEDATVRTVINELDAKLGGNNYDIIVSLTKRYRQKEDSTKGEYEVYVIYSTQNKSAKKQLFECRYKTIDKTNFKELKQVENKSIEKIDSLFASNLRKAINHSLHYHVLYHSDFPAIDSALSSKI